MCGIAGILGKKVEQGAIQNCSKSIAHRGPDATGVFQHNDVCLIHRRLSIIDLSDAANQPMYSDDGKWVIVFNGEIYNYEEIRNRLISEGEHFKTHSDTEVVLKAFIKYGESCVDEFIGMFAIAIFNTAEEKLFLFRDRVGVKPLYYYYKNDVLIFGSELRSLLSWGVVEKKINKDGLAAYISLGYLPAEYCIINEVKKVAPGHSITWDKQKNILTTKAYWSLQDKITGAHKTNSLEENVARLEEIMISAVKYRMVADVPVGIFLSGGIDSSLVTALLQKHFGNIKTFTIGFDDPVYNEAEYANKIAAHLGTDHYSRILTAADAKEVLNEYFEMYDEPFADSSGIPTNLVSKFARENGCKVVLSADGGDELFGGYSRYINAAISYNKFEKIPAVAKGAYQFAYNNALHHTLHSSWKNAGNKLGKLKDWIHSTKKGFSVFYPAYLSVPNQTLVHRITGAKYNYDGKPAAYNIPPAEAMMAWDFANYLPDDLLVKVDRATMYNHIEGREPLLDHRLIEFAFNLPLDQKISGGTNKVILRELLDKYIPRSYFERPKMGFSIPLFKWFGKDLEHEFEWAFSKSTLAAIDYLDSTEVSKQYQLYHTFKKQGKQDNLLLVWHLYCLIKWHYRYMQNL